MVLCDCYTGIAMVELLLSKTTIVVAQVSNKTEFQLSVFNVAAIIQNIIEDTKKYMINAFMAADLNFDEITANIKQILANYGQK